MLTAKAFVEPWMPFKRLLLAGLVGAISSPVMAAQPPSGPVAGPVAAGPAQPPPAKPAPAPIKPTKATPEQRAEAERLEPLARAAFWAREVDIDAKDTDARLKLVKALRALGKFEEAADTAEQLLVIQPDNFEALLETARDRIASNQGFFAIEPAQRAEALAPRDWRPVSLLAIALEQADRDQEALEAHMKALSLAPQNPATLTNLGMYYAAHGDPARAEPLLRQAAAVAGATMQERQNLALVLGLEGKVAEAERLERQDLPPPVVDNNLGYFKAAANPGAPGDHTWDSLKSAQ
jgi:Flp pilus assembly protein TadD